MIALDSLKQSAYNELFIFLVSALLFCLLYTITYHFIPKLSLLLTIVVWCVWALPIYAIIFLTVTCWYVVGSIAILIAPNSNVLADKNIVIEYIPGVIHLLTMKGFYYFVTLIIISWLTVVLMSYLGTLHNDIYAYIGCALSLISSFIIADFLTRIIIIDGQHVIKENINAITEIVNLNESEEFHNESCIK